MKNIMKNKPRKQFSILNYYADRFHDHQGNNICLHGDDVIYVHNIKNSDVINICLVLA